MLVVSTLVLQLLEKDLITLPLELANVLIGSSLAVTYDTE